LPLEDRKHRLHGLAPSDGERLLYCDYVESVGEELFQLVCQRDLGGVVAKRKFDPYLPSASWVKIRNREYSQWVGQEELFERERHQEPAAGWHSGDIACAGETIIGLKSLGPQVGQVRIERKCVWGRKPLREEDPKITR